MFPTDFLVGETCRFSVAIVDAAAVAADPDTLRLRLRDPAGALTTYLYGAAVEIVRSATGAFHADITLAAAGTWVYRWEADTPNPGAAEGSVTVTRSAI